MHNADLEKLSDKDLFKSLEALSTKENEATLQVLRHLIEIERRKSYLRAGYSSLFD